MAKPEQKQTAGDAERDAWWKQQIEKTAAREAANNPYAQDALRRQRLLEQRDAQQQAEEAQRIRDLPELERGRLAALAEAQGILAAQPAPSAPASTAKPDLDVSWRVARRPSPSGPEWRGWVVDDVGKKVIASTQWLTRAAFLAEVVLMRRHFNVAVFDGVGTPHVW